MHQMCVVSGCDLGLQAQPAIPFFFVPPEAPCFLGLYLPSDLPFVAISYPLQMFVLPLPSLSSRTPGVPPWIFSCSPTSISENHLDSLLSGLQEMASAAHNLIHCPLHCCIDSCLRPPCLSFSRLHPILARTLAFPSC